MSYRHEWIIGLDRFRGRDKVDTITTPIPDPILSSGAKLAIMVLGMMPAAQAEEVAVLAGKFIGEIVSETIEDALDKRFGNTAEIGKANDELQKNWNNVTLGVH